MSDMNDISRGDSFDFLLNHDGQLNSGYCDADISDNKHTDQIFFYLNLNLLSSTHCQGIY